MHDKPYMRKLFSALLVAFTICQGYSQQKAATSDKKNTPISKQATPADKAAEYANTITAEDLSRHLHIIASDSLEGRETGERGQKMAANYIATHFFNVGLQAVVSSEGGSKSFYQPFELIKKSWGQVYVETGTKRREFLKDFYIIGDLNYPDQTNMDVVFAGYGIETPKYSDYGKIDVKGKSVMVWSGEPTDRKGNAIISGNKDASEWATNWRKKVATAKEKGASLVFVVTKDQAALESTINQYRGYFMHPSLGFRETGNAGTGTVFISPGMAAEILGFSERQLERQQKRITRRGKSTADRVDAGSISLKAERKEEIVITENVLGYMEGTDKKEELIVITAHYDHEGIQDGQIYNGADDDGSGTVAVLEMAEAFAEAKSAGFTPRRSILFMTVTAEEKGLLGSEYYTQSPVFPLQSTVVNLNIDMIGRVDKAHEGNADYIYVIGADKLSSELHKINEEANQKYTKLNLDYTYNDPNDPNRFYYRSDHYNFAKNRIPVAFYFNGVHDDYHRPTDDVEKINFQKMEKITRLVFHTAWELANRDQRIVVDSNKQ
jgi:hypothetical protein